MSETSPAAALVPEHEYSGDPKHCHACALRAFVNAELRTRVELKLAAALRGGGSSPLRKSVGEIQKADVCVPAYFDNAAERDAYQSGYCDAVLSGGGSSPTGETWRETVQLVVNNMGDVTSLGRFARAVDPIRLVADWKTDLEAALSAPSSQATPPPPLAPIDVEYTCGCRYSGHLASASCPFCGNPEKGAAPSSSPAPSGRRQENKEKDVTRSPSPDVIPAAGSPRTTPPKGSER